MWWSARRLRSLSALCLALLVYSAIPHFHADSGSLPYSRQTFGGSFDVGVSADNRLPVDESLAPDVGHESHSSSASLDSEPCALCRGQVGRELAATAPGLIPLAVAEDSGREWTPTASRAERIFARRHPARGPPLA